MKKHLRLQLLILAAVVGIADVTSSANDTIIIVTNDTLYDVVTRLDSTSRDTVIYTEREQSRRSHYVQFLAGGGWGTLNYALSDGGRVSGTPHATVQLQYAWFFHEHWGLSVGASCAATSSKARLTGERKWAGQTDSDGEPYEHHTVLTDWQERQTVHQAAIPIALQWQHVWNEKAGLYLMIGADAQLAVMSSYKTVHGDLIHKGYYEDSHLWLDDVHEFGPRTRNDKGKLLTTLITPGVFADLGLVLPAGKQTDILLGGYFHYTVTDLNASSHSPLGWQDADYAWMPAYDGVWNSNEAGASRPWAAGVKIGVQWHARQKPAAEHRTLYDYFTTEQKQMRIVERRDTTIRVSEPQIAHVEPEPAVQPKQKLPEATTTGIQKVFRVYFGLNSADITPEIELEVMLILETLRSHPEWRAEISGYSCSIGTHAYNERLSLRRAQNVAKVLQDNGISAKRLKITAYGDSKAHQNATEAEAAEDRHVRVNIIGKD